MSKDRRHIQRKANYRLLKKLSSVNNCLMNSDNRAYSRSEIHLLTFQIMNCLFFLVKEKKKSSELFCFVISFNVGILSGAKKLTWFSVIMSP